MLQQGKVEQQTAWWEGAWSRAKIWRTVRMGPIAAHFRLGRANVLTKSGVRRIGTVRSSPDLVASNSLAGDDRVDRRDVRAETAAVFGMGAGFGEGLVRSLVARNMTVATVCRDASRWDGLISELRGKNGVVNAYPADVTSESSVRRCVADMERDLAVPDLAVYCVQSFIPGGVLETRVDAFEEAWRANCLGAFIVAREVGARMAARGSGTIVFAGATSGTIGRAGYLNLAVGKFGLRALAQVMARELGHRGVHVVHLVIDACIDEGDGAEEGPVTDAGDLGKLVHTLHQQPRSVWTHELDVRPWNERFWEHC